MPTHCLAPSRDYSVLGVPRRFPRRCHIHTYTLPYTSYVPLKEKKTGDQWVFSRKGSPSKQPNYSTAHLPPYPLPDASPPLVRPRLSPLHRPRLLCPRHPSLRRRRGSLSPASSSSSAHPRLPLHPPPPRERLGGSARCHRLFPHRTLLPHVPIVARPPRRPHASLPWRIWWPFASNSWAAA